MKDKNIAIEATYWYSLLENIGKDPNISPAFRKIMRKYIKNELIRIKKEMEEDE